MEISAEERRLTIIWDKEKAELIRRIESLESDVRVLMDHLGLGNITLK